MNTEKVGKVIQVIGPVVDVEFDGTNPPRLGRKSSRHLQGGRCEQVFRADSLRVLLSFDCSPDSERRTRNSGRYRRAAGSRTVEGLEGRPCNVDSGQLWPTAQVDDLEHEAGRGAHRDPGCGATVARTFRSANRPFPGWRETAARGRPGRRVAVRTRGVDDEDPVPRGQPARREPVRDRKAHV